MGERLRAVGRLLRLSLTVSALADVAAGVLLGARGWPGGTAPWALVLASACVYHGGMALNDWADREHDARTRPDRPIPSGVLSARFALGLGLALLAGGSALALWVNPVAGAALSGVAALAFLYDVAGRGPWSGPLLLGLCRGGNLGAGLLLGAGLVGSERTLAWLLPPALAYALYVFVVSRLGRLEDAEDALALESRTPSVLVAAAALCLLTPACLPLEVEGSSRLLSLAIAGAGAFGLLRVAAAKRSWTAAEIPPVMGMALRRLLVFSASVAVLAGSPAGWIGGGLILAGFPLSHALRRVFPPS